MVVIPQKAAMFNFVHGMWQFLTKPCMVAYELVLHDNVHMYQSNSQLTAWVGVNAQVTM